jgi:hypothetical protein
MFAIMGMTAERRVIAVTMREKNQFDSAACEIPQLND